MEDRRGPGTAAVKGGSRAWHHPWGGQEPLPSGGYPKSSDTRPGLSLQPHTKLRARRGGFTTLAYLQAALAWVALTLMVSNALFQRAFSALSSVRGPR